MVFSLVDFEESISSIDIDSMKQNHAPLIIGIVSAVIVITAVSVVFLIKKKKH